MGSRNDYAVMRALWRCCGSLAWRMRRAWCRRIGRRICLFEYAEKAVGRGLRVIIAGAGGAAHLPGMLAAKTVVPVLGVPIAGDGAAGAGFAAVDCADAEGHSCGNAGDWRGGRGECGAAGDCDAVRRRDAELREKLMAWRAARRDEVLAQTVGGDRARLRVSAGSGAATSDSAGRDDWHLWRRPAWAA